MILKEFSDDVERVFEYDYPNQPIEDAVYDLIECVQTLELMAIKEELGKDMREKHCAMCVGAATVGLANVCNKLGIDFTESVDKYWLSFKEASDKDKYADSMAANA